MPVQQPPLYCLRSSDSLITFFNPPYCRSLAGDQHSLLQRKFATIVADQGALGGIH